MSRIGTATALALLALVGMVAWQAVDRGLPSVLPHDVSEWALDQGEPSSMGVLLPLTLNRSQMPGPASGGTPGSPESTPMDPPGSATPGTGTPDPTASPQFPNRANPWPLDPDADFTNVAWHEDVLVVGATDTWSQELRFYAVDTDRDFDPSEDVKFESRSELLAGTETIDIVTRGGVAYAWIYDEMASDSPFSVAVIDLGGAVDPASTADPSVAMTLPMTIDPFIGGGIVLTGDLLAVAEHDGVILYELSDPLRPNRLAELSTGQAYGMAAKDSWLYVSTARHLYTYSLLDPGRPRRVAADSTLPGGSWHMAASGSVLALAQKEGLRLYDISEPSAPEPAGSMGLRGQASAIVVADGWCLVATAAFEPDEQSGVHMIDVADLHRPNAVDFLQSAGTYDIALRDEILALATSTGPKLARVEFGLGRISMVAEEAVMRGYFSQFAVDPDDEVVYLADWFRGLTAVDVSDPSAPRPLSAVGGRVWDADVVGDRAYMISDRTYQVVDVSNAANLEATGAVLDPAPLTDVLATPRLGFLSDFSLTAVVDHSGRDLELLGSLSRHGGVTALAGAHLLVASQDSLDVYAVPDSGMPELVGEVDFDGPAASMAVDGNTVFAPKYYDPEIAVFDISEPTRPVLVDTWAVGDDTRWHGFRYGATASGGLLAVSETYAGVLLIDASDRTDLHVLAWIRMPAGTAGDVELRGDLLYVAAVYDFLIFDVSDPTNPQLIGRLELPG